MTAVRALLEEGVDRGWFAGAAAVVSGEEGIREELYVGDARVEPEGESAPVGPETLWDLASTTKPLAGAALVLALTERRQLALEDTIGRFGDAYKKTRFDGVTLERLLTHSAGLAAWYPCYVKGEGRAAYRRALTEVDPAGPPGRAVLYSCLGYLLLADVVENAAGEPLDDFFRRRISAPLGLAQDLLFSPEGTDRGRCAGGERDDATERRMVRERHLHYVGFRSGVVNGEANDGNAYRRGAGVSLNAGLFGTARAAAALAAAWLTRDARLLSESSIEQATRSLTEGLEEERGLGWQMAATKGSSAGPLSPAAYGHTGFTGASVWVDPDSRAVYVLLANRLHPDARAVDMNAFRRRFHGLARS